MSKQSERDPYRGRDPRQIPAYTLFDAARYLHLPARTIQNWAYGESGASNDFSFFNLVELHERC